MRRIFVKLLEGAAAGVVATLGMSLVMFGAKKVGALGEPPPRPRNDCPGRPASMIVAHLVYGAALAAVYRQLPAASPEED